MRSATPDVGSQARSVIAAVSALCSRVPLDGADRTELDLAMRELRTLRSFYDTMDVLIARRSRQLAEAGKAGPASDTLAAGGRRSKRDAKAASDREQVCDRLPIVEDALGNGSMSAGHVDAIANATASLNDEAKARFDAHAAELTERAAVDTVERFARYCYQLARRVTRDEGESRLNDQKQRNSLRYWIDNQTGMYHIHCELDPETGARVITAITHHTNTVKHRKNDAAVADEPVADDAQPTAAQVADDEPVGPEHKPRPTAPTPAPQPAAEEPVAPADQAAAPVHEPDTDTVAPKPEPAATTEPAAAAKAAPSIDKLAADAFVELVTGAQSLDRRVPEVSVLIDLDTLLNGLSHDSCSETSTGTLLPPETIRRLACDGDLVPIVLGSHGETLDVGRSSRLATPSQRRALRAMYATCANPGCQVPFDVCDIHHIVEWKAFGPTDLANLVPLCSQHHHMVHEGGWKLAMRTDRTIRLTRPDGTIHFQDITINRRAREPAA